MDFKKYKYYTHDNKKDAFFFVIRVIDTSEFGTGMLVSWCIQTPGNPARILGIIESIFVTYDQLNNYYEIKDTEIDFIDRVG